MADMFLGNLRVTPDDLDLLEKLTLMDGERGSMFVYDTEFVSALKSQGLVKMNIKGWIWGTDRLRDLLPKMRQKMEGQSILVG
jgi:hypothetical protein